MKTHILLGLAVTCLLIGIGCNKKSESIPPGEKLSITNQAISGKSPLIIENVDKYPDNTVNILDSRNGKLVYKIVNYNNKDVIFPSKSYSHLGLAPGQYQCVIHTKGKNISLGYFKLKH